MADIFLQSISHSYESRPKDGAAGDNYVLREVDLHWRDGGAYALLGPSGCGKTTLLNIMSGLIRPTMGTVRYGDVDVTELPTERRNIAQVFQFPVIYDTMTVFGNLAFPLRNRGMGAAAIDKRVREVAEMLELEAMLDSRAVGLTPDLKQIIALGRGLVRDEVAAILFDEPLTVIDPHKKWQLRRKLREIHRRFDHTMVYVTHDQTEALTFADEVVVMYEGKVLQTGSPEALFERPEHRYVGYFIGSPGMNFFPSTLADDGVDGRAASLVIAGHRLPWPRDPAEGLVGVEGLELGIRPEHVRLLPSDAKDDGDGGAATMPMVVADIEDLGGSVVVSGALLGTGDERLAVKLKVADAAAERARRLEPGSGCRVLLPMEHVHLYRDQQIV